MQIQLQMCMQWKFQKSHLVKSWCSLQMAMQHQHYLIILGS